MVEKICSNFKKPFSNDGFYKNRTTGDGLTSWCKLCVNERHKGLYIRDKEKILRKHKLWRANNPLRVNSLGRKWRKNNPIKQMVIAAKSRALRKNLPFNITIEDVTIPNMCPVLGIPIVIGQGKVDRSTPDNAPSLDRIVPAKGYTKGNVQVISKRANALKWDSTIEELEKVLAYMRLHDNC